MSIALSIGIEMNAKRRRWRAPFRFRIGLGLALLAAWTLCALFAVSISGQEPVAYDIYERHHAPSRAHYFGTDDLGRDIFGRVLYGARFTLGIGYTVSITTMVIGSAVGTLISYQPTLDRAIMRFLDAISAVPGLILALAILAVHGPGRNALVLSLTLALMPLVTRAVRARATPLRRAPYV